jgi:hypothetical protein
MNSKALEIGRDLHAAILSVDCAMQEAPGCGNGKREAKQEEGACDIWISVCPLGPAHYAMCTLHESENAL